MQVAADKTVMLRRLIVFTMLAMMLAAVSLTLIPSSVSATHTCTEYTWQAGDCCCGSVRCTKLETRLCHVDGNVWIPDDRCNFFSNCTPN